MDPDFPRPFDRMCSFRRDGFAMVALTNGDFLQVEIRVSTALAVSLGRPDHRLTFADRAEGTIGSWQMFVRPDGRFSPAGWIGQRDVQQILDELASQDTAHILISSDRLLASFRPAGLDVDWKRLDVLLALARSLPVSDSGSARVETASLPKSLKPLSPLMSRWSIADDLDRAIAIAEASDESLRELWESVQPKLPAIDRYLDANLRGEVHSESLSSLTQAAIEAGRELARRQEA